MLTLNPGSACDVCAEEYGPHRQPHSIPCGHVLCASCCTKILEKTSSRLTPGCPFCRVPFTSDGIRIIRTDFYTSGWSTPRRFPTVEAHSADFTSEMLAKKTERLLLSEGCSRTRLEARRLEDKVAKVAAKKCSVEEVSTLHRELEDWLMSEVKDDQTSSLYLSAALLRAILHNHLAHSEASKTAKTTEEKLTKNINDLNSNIQHLETELRRQRQQYQQKSEECQQLRTEVNRLKALATTIGGSDYRPMSPTTPAPTPCTSPIPPAATPISRFTSMHGRSASMSSRPSTPASTPVSPSRPYTPAPPRSHTPAVPPRSHTPAAPTVRSHTPSLSYRSNTPAPPMPRYTSTPTPPSHLRPITPAPLVPPKPRRLSTSHSTPPKMARSSSDDRPLPELWIPPGGTRPPSRAAAMYYAS